MTDTQTTGFVGSFERTMVDGALKAIAHLHPNVAPFINLILDHEPELERLAPVLAAAAKEGPGAFAAAEKEAPELAQAIRNLAAAVPGEAATHEDSAATVDRHAENITRHLVGLGPMDEDEEKALLDRATPHNDPAEENSKFGG